MVWALIFTPFLVALLIGYTINRLMLGQEVAGRSLVATLLFLLPIVALVCVLLFLPHPWGDYALASLFIICSIILWSIILTWLRRKQRAGHLLWNLGRPSTHRLLWIIGAVFALSAVFQTEVFINLATKEPSGNYSQPEFYLSQIILYGSIAFYFFWASLSRLEIRENGIYFKFGLIEWKQIAACKWEGAKGQTLTVWLKQRFPFFLSKSWLIPLTHKPTIERFLSRHLAGRTKSNKKIT